MLCSMGAFRSPQKIDLLVIHCSASPNGKWATARDIDEWHAKRGFRRNPDLIGAHAPHLKHIGYHFVILTSGGVEVGRALREIGAHAKGHNQYSIGTCLIGTDKFTQAQWHVLRQHVQGLQRAFPGLRVVGHRDLSPDLDGDGTIDPHEWIKTCPGFDVAAWMAGGMAPLTNQVCADARPNA